MKDNKSTILIVDDTETNIDILLELLDDKYDVIVSLSSKEALHIVKEEDIDLILLDVMMPNIDGYEICTRIKADKKAKNIPIIFITARVDEDSIEKAYDVGGADYIVKPFKPKELVARVKTQLKIKELINHLDYIASHDYMTDIYNRRKFFELGHKKFHETRKNLFIAMIDIDEFKLINDTYGHPIGDRVIKLVTTGIAKNLHENSIFGRLGGEEFAIICDSEDIQSVKDNIEQIRKKIENCSITLDSGEIIKFTISEGLAKLTPEIKTLDELLKKADAALYEAKGLGRNRVVFRT